MKNLVRCLYGACVILLLFNFSAFRHAQQEWAIAELTGASRNPEPRYFDADVLHVWFSLLLTLGLHLACDIRQALWDLVDRPTTVEELRAYKGEKAAT